MGLYSAAVTTTAAASGSAFCTLWAGTGTLLQLRRLIVSSDASTVVRTSLLRTGNTPVATTSVVGQPHDPDDPASTGVLATAWSTAPTANIFITKECLVAQQGVTLWHEYWPPLVVGVAGFNKSLVVWNWAGVGIALSVSATWEE